MTSFLTPTSTPPSVKRHNSSKSKNVILLSKCPFINMMKLCCANFIVLIQKLVKVIKKCTNMVRLEYMEEK